MGSGFFFPLGAEWQGPKSDHSPPSKPRLRMSGAIHLLFLYAFMELKGQFYLYPYRPRDADKLLHVSGS